MEEYTVQEGDTLSEILYEHTGDGSYQHYMEVAEQNGISDPNKIYEGQVITFDNGSSTNSSSSVNQGTYESHSTSSSSANTNTTTTPSASNANTGVSQTTYDQHSNNNITATDDGWDLGSDAEDDIFGENSNSSTSSSTSTNRSSGATTGSTSTNRSSGSTTGSTSTNRSSGSTTGSTSTNRSSGSTTGSTSTNRSSGSTTTSTNSNSTTGGNGTASTSNSTTGGNGTASRSNSTTGGNGTASKSNSAASTVSQSTGTNFGTAQEIRFAEVQECICYPIDVKTFEPQTNYNSFKVKDQAGEKFVAVNNKVKQCGEDIDDVILAMNTIKTKMGENCGTINILTDVNYNLEQKKQDLINKNKELLQACNEVIQYIYKNKADKSEEAGKIETTIANISLYEG